MAKQLSEAEKLKRRERRRLWREENRDEYRAQQRASYERRKEALAAKRRDPDFVEAKRAYDKGYRAVNADKIGAKKREYYVENKSAIIARVVRNRRAKQGVIDVQTDQ